MFFEGTRTKEEILCDRIKYSVAQWVKINTPFKDYSTHQIVFNWKELAFSLSFWVQGHAVVYVSFLFGIFSVKGYLAFLSVFLSCSV